MNGDLQRVCAQVLAGIADDAAAGRVGPSRLRGWRRDEPQTEEQAEAWLAAHPSAEAVSRTAFEDAGADRLYDEPGDPLLDREPMGGSPYWAEDLR